jgi:predicted SAM-dependent methyltransferase
MKNFLHIGCGTVHKSQTTRGFSSDDWQEIRVDIDPSVSPHLVGSMKDLSVIPSGSIDAIFSSHNIEHLYPHEVITALREFLRVLRVDGFVVITCPDLQSVCALVADDKLTDPVYVSPLGPVSPLDILYGFRPSLAAENFFMAHNCGFTQKVLQSSLSEAGFVSVATARRSGKFLDLWALACKSKVDEVDLRKLAEIHFPF